MNDKNFTDIYNLARNLETPQESEITIDVRQDPPSIAKTMTVDRIIKVLESAEKGDIRDLMTLYRDVMLASNHIQAEFGKRKLAVIGDNLNITASDEDSEVDKALAKSLKAQLDNCSGFIESSLHLMDSTLWPVSLVEKLFRPSKTEGLRYDIAGLKPVPHELLDCTQGPLMLRDTSPEGKIESTQRSIDPNRYIVHRGHILGFVDKYGGPFRSILFWWLLSAMGRDWWSKFMDRYGSPFPVGYYDTANDKSRTILQRAFNLATRIGGLVVSKDTKIELQQAAAGSTGEAHERFITLCNKEMSKLIIGQTSADTEKTGLNSGVSKMHAEIRQDIRQFDALLLSRTYTTDLIHQFVKINQLQGSVSLSWGSESTEEAESTATVLTALSGNGLRVTDEALPVLSKKIGFSIERDPGQRKGPLPLSTLAILPGDELAEQSAKANLQLARSQDAELSQLFRGAHAPIRQAILQSSSPEDCINKVQALYADYSPKKLQRLISDIMQVYTYNGLEASTP